MRKPGHLIQRPEYFYLLRSRIKRIPGNNASFTKRIYKNVRICRGKHGAPVPVKFHYYLFRKPTHNLHFRVIHYRPGLYKRVGLFHCLHLPCAAMQTDTLRSDKQVANWLLLCVHAHCSDFIGRHYLAHWLRTFHHRMDVVTGTLPPLNEQAWLNEFTKYKATPQYRLLNTDFTITNFKFIFFWEWFHRFWACMMGVVFAVGFIFFLAKGYFRKEMIKPLIILLFLGVYKVPLVDHGCQWPRWRCGVC